MLIMRDQFFYPILTQIIDSSSFTPSIAYCILIFEIEAPNVPEYAEKRHDIMTSPLYYIDATCVPVCGCSFSILPTDGYWVPEIEFLQMAENSRKFNLWCKRYHFAYYADDEALLELFFFINFSLYSA